ncbi:MAG: hypothetical protein DHS80DRAFT_22939 [Piptocephalis tieghemiana]|nr:MAG: hypothetical protein DHS80DRAFT_22939 [Piptocephalis tieghemiana]
MHLPSLNSFLLALIFSSALVHSAPGKERASDITPPIRSNTMPLPEKSSHSVSQRSNSLSPRIQNRKVRPLLLEKTKYLPNNHELRQLEKKKDWKEGFSNEREASKALQKLGIYNTLFAKHDELLENEVAKKGYIIGMDGTRQDLENHDDFFKEVTARTVRDLYS